jgi:threonine dehydrogenase-like Zn-dependent dehydrogenase
MKATILTGVRGIEVHEVPDPALHFPTDALVTVTASCICGSDLHHYRGLRENTYPKRIGHEYVGVVSDVGAEVTSLKPGDFVVAPFAISDGTCAHCLNGVPTSCVHGSYWGSLDRSGVLADGGQAEQVRVPYADGTLVKVDAAVEKELVPDLLALSDVMGTGWHAAVSADVGPGSSVVVVGDGAVGLCAVLACRQLRAARIIVMSRHETRQNLAIEFGATDVVAQRGQEGVERIMELLNGVGADCVLECVGTSEAFDQAIACTRPGGRIGGVGAPSYQLPIPKLFSGNIAVHIGVAPVRAYLPALLNDVMNGEIHPGRVFDLELPLDDVAEGYRAMDERSAIKVLLRP